MTMSSSRRNLDYAFPSFAPDLPSVYERAGFDVSRKACSIRSRATHTSSSVRSNRPVALPTPSQTPEKLDARGSDAFAFESPTNMSQRAPSPVSSTSPENVAPLFTKKAPEEFNFKQDYPTPSLSSNGSASSASSARAVSVEARYPPANTARPTTSLAAPNSDVNRFSSTSSIYSLAPMRSRCPYPDDDPRVSRLNVVSEEDGAEHHHDAVPEAPPLAPQHAQRLRDKTMTHSSSSSSSSGSNITEPTHPKMCRGCHQVIKGRSVHSKDGLLTGRWHRSCFVCTDCGDSLGSDVYVYQNSPFCHHCYHTINMSMCATCGSGIEGACLATEGEETHRFHLGCLQCIVCEQSLQSEYFEAGGRVYCQTHAGKARRRTTRLLS